MNRQWNEYTCIHVVCTSLKCAPACMRPNGMNYRNRNNIQYDLLRSNNGTAYAVLMIGNEDDVQIQFN